MVQVKRAQVKEVQVKGAQVKRALRAGVVVPPVAEVAEAAEVAEVDTSRVMLFRQQWMTVSLSVQTLPSPLTF